MAEREDLAVEPVAVALAGIDCLGMAALDYDVWHEDLSDDEREDYLLHATAIVALVRMTDPHPEPHRPEGGTDD